MKKAFNPLFLINIILLSNPSQAADPDVTTDEVVTSATNRSNWEPGGSHFESIVQGNRTSGVVDTQGGAVTVTKTYSYKSGVTLVEHAEISGTYSYNVSYPYEGNAASTDSVTGTSTTTLESATKNVNVNLSWTGTMTHDSDANGGSPPATEVDQYSYDITGRATAIYILTPEESGVDTTIEDRANNPVNDDIVIPPSLSDDYIDDIDSPELVDEITEQDDSDIAIEDDAITENDFIPEEVFVNDNDNDKDLPIIPQNPAINNPALDELANNIIPSNPNDLEGVPEEVKKPFQKVIPEFTPESDNSGEVINKSIIPSETELKSKDQNQGNITPYIKNNNPAPESRNINPQTNKIIKISQYNVSSPVMNNASNGNMVMRYNNVKSQDTNNINQNLSKIINNIDKLPITNSSSYGVSTGFPKIK